MTHKMKQIKIKTMLHNYYNILVKITNKEITKVFKMYYIILKQYITIKINNLFKTRYYCLVLKLVKNIY